MIVESKRHDKEPGRIARYIGDDKQCSNAPKKVEDKCSSNYKGRDRLKQTRKNPRSREKTNGKGKMKPRPRWPIHHMRATWYLAELPAMANVTTIRELGSFSPTDRHEQSSPLVSITIVRLR